MDLGSVARRHIERIAEALDWLGRSPACLVTFLLAINAGANSYVGIVHDAALYSLQGLNRAMDGAFAGDVFLKYGSQDRFSVYSTVTAPLVAALGVQPTFFILYLASTALLLYAALRLLRCVIHDRAVAIAGAVFVAVAPMPYGGLGVFHVAEAFFTPRLPASALTLLALEQLLRQRYAWALLPLAGAVLLHPIMAFPGLLVSAGQLVLTRLRPWQAIVLGVVGALGVLVAVVHPSAAGMAPSLDAAWREVIRRAAPYNFPDEWRLTDWMTVVGSLFLASLSAWQLRKEAPAVGRFLAIVAAAAAAGLAVTTVASYASNALVFQAQPYRALWLVALLEGPLGLWIAVRAYRSGSPMRALTAAAIVAYLARNILLPVQASATLIAFPAFWLAASAVNRAPLRDVARPAAVRALLFGAACVILVVPVVLVGMSRRLIFQVGPSYYARTIIASPGVIGWFVVAMSAATYLHNVRHLRRAVTLTLTGTFLLVHGAFFAVPLTSSYQHAFDRDIDSLEFSRSYLANYRRAGNPTPTIYTDWLAPQILWTDLHAKSYFSLIQAAGVMFSRATADEVIRRARIVHPFEARRYHRPSELLATNPKLMVERLFPGGTRDTTPSPDDLARLCGDPVLDLAMITGPRLSDRSVGNGTMHIYDCRDIRAASARADARRRPHSGA